MNYKRSKRLGIKPPIDGYTIEEEKLERLLTECTIETLYSKLPTHRMKAIVALHFELGYTQQIVAAIFGISQPTLVNEICVIQRVLMGINYKPRKTKEPLAPEKLAYIASLLAD